VPDGTDTPALTLDEYVPTARPGHLAPHVWIAPGVSTLDLFGPDFTLLVVGHDVGAGVALVNAARERNMPLTVAAVADPDIVDAMRSAYESRLVLVRPDGHVAWRGDHLPANPGRILDIARGATNINAPTERRSATMSGT
jgi:hypothetical protein